MKKVIYTNEKEEGYFYEVSFRTKEDNKPYYLKWKTNLYISDEKIKSLFERICDIYVSGIKRAVFYKSYKVDTIPNANNNFSAVLTIRYTFNSRKIRTDSSYLPYIKNAYLDSTILGNELKEIFSNDLEITVYSPRT